MKKQMKLFWGPYTVCLLLASLLGACYENERNRCRNIKGEWPGHIVNHPSRIERMSDAELAPLLVPGNEESHRGLLMHAVVCGNPDTVEVLLRRGAQVDIRDDWGATPFLRSMGNRGDSEISLKLLAYGADPTVMDQNNENVLHYAGTYNTPYIFDILDRETLLGIGPNVQAKGDLESPLHAGVRNFPIAYYFPRASYEHSFVYRALQEDIFDRSLRNALGQTAYDRQLDNIHRARTYTEKYDVAEQKRILKDLAFDSEVLARDLEALSKDNDATQQGESVEAQPMPQVGALAVQVPES
ncbi:MAG: hypothetical protein OXT67_12680 [Zetaproteobacteria bacterium]|nr:hypothetical protein [Zetaproteobacteria bacterium]